MKSSRIVASGTSVVAGLATPSSCMSTRRKRADSWCRSADNQLARAVAHPWTDAGTQAMAAAHPSGAARPVRNRREVDEAIARGELITYDSSEEFLEYLDKLVDGE